MSFHVAVWSCCLFFGLVQHCTAPRRYLSVPDVTRAVQLLEDGATQRTVAERFGVARSVIARLWTRFQETGLYSRRPGQGRGRITSDREDRYLRRLARTGRQSTARRLQMTFQEHEGRRLSTQTVRNRLHEGRMRSRQPATGPVLTVQHRVARLEFAREHQNWGLANWRGVLFTDESRFTVSTCDRRVRVWRVPGERYLEENVVRHDRFGGGSVMVWGGICATGRTDLYVIARGTLTAVRYRDEILHPIVRPFAGAVGAGFILVQDNARPHTARLSMQYLEDESIEVMDWPARSPDLNPIEHVWDILGRRVRERNPPPTNVQQLREALVEEWHGIPQGVIQHIVLSMPQRCQECIRSRGGQTHY